MCSCATMNPNVTSQNTIQKRKYRTGYTFFPSKLVKRSSGNETIHFRDLTQLVEFDECFESVHEKEILSFSFYDSEGAHEDKADYGRMVKNESSQIEVHSEKETQLSDWDEVSRHEKGRMNSRKKIVGLSVLFNFVAALSIAISILVSGILIYSTGSLLLGVLILAFLSAVIAFWFIYGIYWIRRTSDNEKRDIRAKAFWGGGAVFVILVVGLLVLAQSL